MHWYILVELGRGNITAKQAGKAYDLISEVETAGTTHSNELAQNKYYQKSVKEWVEAKKIQRERFAKSKSM